MESKKRYKPMENVLNTIISKYVSLSDSEKKRNNRFLDQVTNNIVLNMKNKCVLFSGMFERTFYGGSFYDNLKVGNPNEYDLDFVLNIPVVVEPKLSCTDQPGFVQVQITAFDKMLSRTEKDKFLKLKTLLDDGKYLSVNKVLVWMEKTINLALNDFLTDSEKNVYMDIPMSSEETVRIYIKMSKGPPAFTLRLWGTDKDGEIKLDVDLVPCFQFTDDQWPAYLNGYRKNPSCLKNKFLIVPKKPKGNDIENSATLERYWRLSFQEQERELISGHNLKALKPALRLLKKLRDRQNHKIASYYIKTLFLWALETEDDAFWAQPLSCVFMNMLKRYAEKIADQEIPYYWNDQNNLVGYLKEQNEIILYNIGQCLKNIIEEIERNLDEATFDPFVVGKFLLSTEAYERLRGEVTVGKKLVKSISCSNSLANFDISNTDSVDSSTSGSGRHDPPLLKLGFSNQVVRVIKDYIEHVQEKQVTELEQMFSCKCKIISESGAQKELMNSLNKIDAKIDRIAEKVDKIEEDGKVQKELITQFGLLNKRIFDLEDKVSELQSENKTLKENKDQNNLDQLLYVRQIQDDLGKFEDIRKYN